MHVNYFIMHVWIFTMYIDNACIICPYVCKLYTSVSCLYVCASTYRANVACRHRSSNFSNCMSFLKQRRVLSMDASRVTSFLPRSSGLRPSKRRAHSGTNICKQRIAHEQENQAAGIIENCEVKEIKLKKTLFN